MNYFYILNYYTTPSPRTGHVVRAKSEIEAQQIVIKHKITYPHNKIIDFVTSRILDKKYRFDELLIERRKRGIGGNIWYEDKNGKLQKEI